MDISRDIFRRKVLKGRSLHVSHGFLKGPVRKELEVNELQKGPIEIYILKDKAKPKGRS